MFTEDQQRRYQAACHAMQSGVAFDLERGGQAGTPKHLRVGINSAMVETSVLAKLLVAKGVFTEAEYAEALCVGMEEEADRYAQHLSQAYGVNITLA